MARVVRFCRALGLAVLLLCIAAPVATSAGQERTAAELEPSEATEPSPGGALFIENVGQFGDGARYQILGGGNAAWLAPDAEWFIVAEPQEQDASPEGEESARADSESTPSAVVRLRVSFVNANPAPAMEPFGAVDTHVSYFIGADARDWHSDVPVWSGVRYVDLYPGVDLEVTSENGQLVQRVVAKNEAGVQALPAIQMRIEGADSLTLDGDVVRAETPLGEVTVPLLRGGQTGHEADVSTIASGAYGTPSLHGDVVASPYAAAAAATVQDQPPDRPQDMRYGIAFQDGHNAFGYGIACDEAGAAYFVGTSSFRELPEWSAPGYDLANNGSDDVLILKLNADGTLLEYATFVGGRGVDTGKSIAVNAVGQAHVTGTTASHSFPLIEGIGYDSVHNGLSDAFVIRLSADGCRLLYSTFIGGSKYDRGQGIALDADGAVYVAGDTESRDFPASSGPGYCSTYGGGTYDGFVVKLSSDGSSLSYATFLGGSDDDGSTDIAVDSDGAAYVTGYTKSADLVAVSGPGYDLAFGGVSDAYAVKLAPDGRSLSYATYIGGDQADEGLGIAVDQEGSAYITGYTESSDFPATAGPGFDTSYNGNRDSFAVKLSRGGSRMIYGTFLGGARRDEGDDIAVTPVGSAYVVGITFSDDFPAVMGPGFDTSLRGNGMTRDIFVARLALDGRTLPYATFIGGDADDDGNAIAVDKTGAVYITGYSDSWDFPVIAGPGYLSGSHEGYYVICLDYSVETFPRLYLPSIARRD